ncbi:MAG TPA: polymer-forming cytoskeletal protein, partial [Anaerolineae bacterium]|nr:polymer-forming cytoskeletal protein [Anaerolineae bacterium]
MRGLRIVWMALLAVVLLVPAAPALAFDGGRPDGQVIFGDDFTLEAGERLDGDLVVSGGNVTLEPGSQVDGDVVVWGGDVEVGGIVEGDLAAFGGNVDLQETAVVDGDLVVIGGRVDQDEGAVVRGEQIVNPGRTIIKLRGWPVVIPFGPGPIPFGGLHFTGYSLLWEGLRTVLSVLLMAGLAGLVAVLWPRPAALVGRAS